MLSFLTFLSHKGNGNSALTPGGRHFVRFSTLRVIGQSLDTT
jgi:hypothetical protein